LILRELPDTFSDELPFQLWSLLHRAVDLVADSRYA
jgi:hypothetical protein